MHLADARLVPSQSPGSGRLARYDGAVCLVGTDPVRIGTTALLEACRTHDGDGRSLVDKVGGVVERAGANLPPFVLVTQDGDGLLVAVHGPVSVVAQQASGPLRLDGGDVGTWAGHVVLDAAYLSATVPGGTLEPVPALVDLQRGISPATGFLLLPAGVTPGDLGLDEQRGPVAAPVRSAAPARDLPDPAEAGITPAPVVPATILVPEPDPVTGPEPAAIPDPAVSPSEAIPGPVGVAGPPPPASPAPPAPAPLPDEANATDATDQVDVVVPSGWGRAGQAVGSGEFRLVDLRPAGPPPAAQPLPVLATDPAAPAPPEPPGAAAAPVGAAQVDGVRCPKNHFNDPRSRYCAVCGTALGEASLVVTRGPRPPLGVLVLDSGESFPLVRDRIIGREPGLHPDVVADEADPLLPGRYGPRLSRLHARLRLEGWNVVLVDEGSTNGTFVWDESQRSWIQLDPRVPRVLHPGDHLAFGDLTATFESSIQQ